MSKKNHRRSAGAVGTASAFLGETAVAKAGEVREHLNEAVAAARQTCAAVKQSRIKRAQAADKAVRGNPYRALGIAFGVGALLGFLMSNRSGSES